VLVGHSGVGKSTLVNALVPDAGRSTGVVNAVTGRGRHTSTNALMLPLPPSGDSSDGRQDGWIVDTPGIRSFGLAHVDPDHLIEAFPDLHDLTADCPRGCTHAEGEPECGLDEAVGDQRDRSRRSAGCSRAGRRRRTRAWWLGPFRRSSRPPGRPHRR
jgi:ribosome biogenesis GTPase